MKKLWIAMLTMCLALPLFALAQESGQGGMGQTAPSTGAKHASVKGTISEDGKSFVNDADGKSWTIANPDAVKGHEGHHVQLMGSADASTGQIQVTSVKMLKGEKGSMKKDSTPQ